MTGESDKSHTVGEREGHRKRLGETREPLAGAEGPAAVYKQRAAKQRTELMHPGHVGAQNPSRDCAPLLHHPAAQFSGVTQQFGAILQVLSVEETTY